MADLQPETGPTRIYHSHYLISALANVIALIPGTSRLGSVYAALRIVGLGRKQAFYFTTIQGILINAAATLTMLPQSLTSKTLSLATYSPYLIASALYIVLLHTLLSFLSRELHYILLGCCLYRTCIFPFLYINFA
jgi:undecaprenyl pyrophosphate phosphatase UppP